MAIEKAQYKILHKHKGCEVREYEPQIVAETLVTGDFEVVGNEGFRRLYGYISGKNRSKNAPAANTPASEKIAMTAPVTQEKQAEKIPMTSPVSQQEGNGTWSITFVMPSGYSLETLPEPLDAKVQLKEMPGRVMAAIKYSGSWSSKKYQKKKLQLEHWITQQGLEAVGEPIFARYNPPFMPAPFRRNEVLIPVKRPE